MIGEVRRRQHHFVPGFDESGYDQGERLVGAGSDDEVVGADLSAGGLRLMTMEPIEVGMKLQFEISLTVRKDPFILLGRVVWERQVGKGSECGVEFTDISPDVQMEIDRLVELVSRPGP